MRRGDMVGIDWHNGNGLPAEAAGSGGEHLPYVHSKVFIMDDAFCTIGR